MSIEQFGIPWVDVPQEKSKGFFETAEQGSERLELNKQVKALEKLRKNRYALTKEVFDYLQIYTQADYDSFIGYLNENMSGFWDDWTSLVGDQTMIARYGSVTQRILASIRITKIINGPGTILWSVAQKKSYETSQKHLQDHYEKTIKSPDILEENRFDGHTLDKYKQEFFCDILEAVDPNQQYVLDHYVNSSALRGSSNSKRVEMLAFIFDAFFSYGKNAEQISQDLSAFWFWERDVDANWSTRFTLNIGLSNSLTEARNIMIDLLVKDDYLTKENARILKKAKVKFDGQELKLKRPGFFRVLFF